MFDEHESSDNIESVELDTDVSAGTFDEHDSSFGLDAHDSPGDIDSR